jgi:hypothetical protein
MIVVANTDPITLSIVEGCAQPPRCTKRFKAFKSFNLSGSDSARLAADKLFRLL